MTYGFTDLKPELKSLLLASEGYERAFKDYGIEHSITLSFESAVLECRKVLDTDTLKGFRVLESLLACIECLIRGDNETLIRYAYVFHVRYKD